MPNDRDAIQKAREQAERNYSIAAKKIIESSQQQLQAEVHRQAAAGSVLSGNLWRVTGRMLAERLETLLQARLHTLLDSYALYGVALNDEVERHVMQDVTNMRENQITILVNWASMQPWLGPEATTYISGELSQVSTFFNEVKSAIEERRQHAKSVKDVSASAAGVPLVFVSCGQSTPAERELGKSIASLVEHETGCVAYFAENQTNLEGVTENILKKLNEAVAFVAILHPRGDVSNPNSKTAPSWVRGSVWVEQEVAIAAFISQALQRPMKVRCYVHQTIFREGLRSLLHLNPFLFGQDADIVADLKDILPSWGKLTSHRKQDLLSLKAIIHHRREGIIGGSSDKDDERHMLLVSIENDGEQEARDFRLDVEFPTSFEDGGGGHALRTQSSKPGYVLYRVTNTDCEIDHFYPGDKSPEDLIAFHYAVLGKTKREHPELLQQKVVATVSSGNMHPKTTTKSIAELLE